MAVGAASEVLTICVIRCDVIRNQVGMLDPSGRDIPGGPPEDPSVPIYSSSLVSAVNVYTYTLSTQYVYI